VDDPFTIDLNGAQPGTAGNATYVIGSSPTAVAAAALLTDDDSPNLAGSVLTLGLQGGRSGDVLSIVHQGDGPGQIGLHDNNVIAYEGMLIGHYYGGASIILDASFVPIQAVQALIRAVSFTNVTASPPTSDRIVTFQLRLQNGTTYSEAARVQIATPPSTLQGDAGDNQLTGTDGDDLFRLEHGGNDSASGGGGVDGFIFGGAFNALDSVDGGAGSDQIGLQGVYSGLTLGANSTVNVEMIVLLAGNDTRFMDLGGALTGYNITTVDANVATGQMLTIQANTLRAGENFTLNGAAETDGSFFTFGGEGIENLTGGQQVDGFYFGTGRFGSADRIDGQGGSDQFGLQGNYSGLNALTLGADQLTSVEFIVLMSASDTRFGGGNIGQSFSYTLTMNDGNVAAGQQMIVQANTLRAGEVLTFDGSAETNGSFRLFAGAAADTIIGSQTGDELWGQGGADRIEGRGGADTLRGGLDNDVFAYRGVADSVTASRDKIMDFASGDLIDFAPLAQAVGWSSFQFIGTAAISRGGQLRVEQAGSQAMLEVHVDGDGVADLVIDVTVIDGHTLTAADFLGVSSPQNALAPFGPDHGMLLRPTIEPIAQLADFAF
jgi:Ca2+-binding RTX toxin-like protein